MCRSNAGEQGAHNSSDSQDQDASDSQGGAMDEDDLFAGSMEIDDLAAIPANTGAGQASAHGLNADEDMSEVAEIMLGLKVQTFYLQSSLFLSNLARNCQLPMLCDNSRALPANIGASHISAQGPGAEVEISKVAVTMVGLKVLTASL